MIRSLVETSIPGCFELELRRHVDERGTFLKGFQREAFNNYGLETDFVEAFGTISHARVLRGMHFQLPPADHVKLVYCLGGDAQDILLDLRVGSPTFGKHIAINLSAGEPRAVYIARGVAHGFCVRVAPVVMMYHVTSGYVPELDAGIAWDSFGADWCEPNPIVSVRDAALPRFEAFESPFNYAPPLRRASTIGDGTPARDSRRIQV